jgi:hypothetical protein
VGPGLSFAGLESSGRAFAYTLESSAADRSEEGSARVSDENRMERFRMEHRSDGARGRTDDDISGTVWSISVSISGMRRADQDPGGDRSWGVMHLHPARIGSVRDRQGAGRCGRSLGSRPWYRGGGTRTTHEADKPRHSGARRVPPFRPRHEGEGERTSWRPGGARQAHPHHGRQADLAHR